MMQWSEIHNALPLLCNRKVRTMHLCSCPERSMRQPRHLGPRTKQHDSAETAQRKIQIYNHMHFAIEKNRAASLSTSLSSGVVPRIRVRQPVREIMPRPSLSKRIAFRTYRSGQMYTKDVFIPYALQDNESWKHQKKNHGATETSVLKTCAP